MINIKIKITECKHAILTLLLCFITAVANAQTQKVSGSVSADNGDPLIGVSIKVKGTTRGTTSDVNGHFSLDCSRGEVLEFSYIGFKPTSIKVDKRSRVSVMMTEDVRKLNQVVITGYSQKDIRSVTGSVGILTEDQLKDMPKANVDMLIQGKLAGVNVQAVSGRPGESAKIRIRGTSSITGNNEPLWVVDGVPLQKDMPAMGSSYVRSGDFSTLYANGVAGISPQNIESITVLKDASASAIYGSQAQAGVIVITTKKGKPGKTQLSYSGNVTVQTSPSRDHNLMNSSEKIAYEQSIWDEFSAKGFEAGTYYPRIGIVGQVRSGYGQFAGMTKAEQDAYLSSLTANTTDWFKELFRNTVSMGHDISLSGGTEKLTYLVSGGINTNKGIVKKSASDSYNFSSRITVNPRKSITMNFAVDYSYLKSQAASASFDMFRYAYNANPYERPYNEDGSYAPDNTYFALERANGNVSAVLPSNGVNVMREIDETEMISTSSSTSIRGDITWRLGEHFRITGLAAYTYSTDLSDNEVGKNTYAAWIDRPFEGSNFLSKRIYGNMTQTANTNRSLLGRIQLNYNQTFNGIHTVNAVAGSEIRNNYAKSIFRKVYGYDPVTGNHSLPYLVSNKDSFTDADVQSYASIVSSLSGQSRTENAFASFYGAFDYMLMGRYVVNMTIRSDGSNNFGSKQQFNINPSIGLAWHIDQEQWMRSISNIISNASLRLSCGLTGGVNKSVYPVLIMNYLSTFRNSDIDSYRMGVINNPPNPNLRWEHTQDWNASLDLGFINNRIGLQLGLYRRKGYDLVTPVRVVSTTGFTTQSYNTSEQLNQGVEVSLNASPIRTKNWSWSLAANIAYNQNRLTKYESPTGSIFGDIYVGYPLGKVFAGKATGIDPKTGLITFEERSDFDQSDPYNFANYLFYIGTGNYPWTGGLSTNLSWKSFSVSVNTSFSLGAQIKDYIEPGTNYGAVGRSVVNYINNSKYDIYSGHLNKNKDAAYHWTEDNPVTDGYPRLIDAYGANLGLNNQQVRSSTVQEGAYFTPCSYWKIGSLTFSYSLDNKLCKKIGATSLGVNFTANNLWIITNYPGMNPETPGAVYPMSRSFTFGVNVGF